MSTINLLPDDYILRRRRHHANVMCLVLFSCVMAGVLGAQVVSGWSTRSTRAVLNKVEADYDHAAQMIEQMRTLENQEQALRQRAELTSSLIERAPRSTLLAVVAKALPDGAAATDLDLSTGQIVRGSRRTKFEAAKGTPAGQAETTMVMTITGVASTDVQVARFIANLARCPLCASVDLVYSQQKPFRKDVLVREFQVRAELRPDVDAIELKHASAGRDDAATPPPDDRRPA